VGAEGKYHPQIEPPTPVGGMAGSIYPLTVLVVDDNRDAADILAAIVRQCGHVAVTAYTPTEAVMAVAAASPDAIMMDIGIPGMDGYRLARKLCDRLTWNPLLIAVTGHPGLEERSRQEGFDHHFVKPFDTGSLVVLLYAHSRRLAGGQSPAGGAGPLQPGEAPNSRPPRF
jgi:CheY-like chemotaxis protein